MDFEPLNQALLKIRKLLAYKDKSNNSNESNTTMKNFYKKNWFMIAMLFTVSPIGIYLMWYYKANWFTAVKVILTAFFTLYFMTVCMMFSFF